MKPVAGFAAAVCSAIASEMNPGPAMFMSSSGQQDQAFDLAAWNTHRYIRAGYNNRHRSGYPGDPGRYRFPVFRPALLEPKPGRITAQ